ncbi:alpha/beta hydrolase [Paenibacillus crassostreae]|uniref:alpha/beta hydrolase n=1 Tax=Paenibacillus crassostreae TaxID=1763538 RepID=UPI0012FF8A0C|nr:alpha/beta hydrolase-fold protein [Paenibacillus crassostreae]
MNKRENNLYVGKLAMLLILSFLMGCSSTGNTKGIPSSYSSPEMKANEDSPMKISKLESITIPSKALDKDMRATIYLPPGYQSDQSYPVLYLLYGYGGNENSWFTYLHMGDAADRLIESNLIDSLIIVSPDYGNSFGVNSDPMDAPVPVGVDAGFYEDYLIHELVPYVDRTYSTMKDKQGRWIGGISMGGYAALMLGFTYPEMFSKIGAHSAALWTYNSTDQFTGQRDWLYANPALRELRDPFLLSRSNELNEMTIFLDAGVEDPLSEKDELLYQQLQEEGISAQWETSPGGHDFAYWSSRLDDYLLFYAELKM